MPAAPYHYTGAIRELTEALHHLLDTSDWHDTPPADATRDDADRQELGNLIAAQARIKNVWITLDDRMKDLDATVRLRERPALAGDEERRRIVEQTDDSHLPPALRREPSLGTSTGTPGVEP